MMPPLAPCCPIHGPSVPSLAFLLTAQTSEMASSPSVSYRGSLSPYFSLPFLRWRRGHPNQSVIGETLPNDRPRHTAEPISIDGLSGVVAEGLLIEIPEQVKRLDANVGALDSPLQQAPEILQSIGVNLVPNVTLGVVNDLVSVCIPKQGIGWVSVGEDVRASFDIPPDYRAKDATAGVGENLCPNAAVAVWPVPLQEAHNDGLADDADGDKDTDTYSNISARGAPCA